MILPLILSLGFGIVAVSQATLNRILTKTYGVSISILINSFILMSLSIALFLLTKSSFNKLIPDIFLSKDPSLNISWWYFLPGLCGFILITGMPIFITHFNTFSLFIGMITGQLIASLCVDILANGDSFTWQKGIGALLAILGAIISKI